MSPIHTNWINIISNLKFLNNEFIVLHYQINKIVMQELTSLLIDLCNDL